MRRTGRHVLSLFAVAAATACQSDANTTNVRGIDVRNLDETADACVDFYQYANGTWLANNPVPEDRSRWSTGSEIQERNFDLLHRLLDEAAAETTAEPGSAAQMVGDFYASAMDTARVEADGVAPLQEELERIAGLTDARDIESFITDLHQEGAFILFQFGPEADFQNSDVNMAYVIQGGLGLPEKDYYLRDDEESATLRQEYTEHIRNMLGLLGDDLETAQRGATAVMEMETNLAEVSLGAVELRDPANYYRPMSPQQADRITDSFSWSRYFAAQGLEDVSRFSFPHSRFFERVNTMLTERSLDDWRAYLRWHLISTFAPYLSSDFVEERFRFYGTILNGTQEMQERWKRALQATDAAVGELLGQLYVAEAFPPESKRRAQEMVANITTALRERLGALEWMSDETRTRALAKLATFNPKIGYPDTWRDYSALSVTRGPYAAAVRAGNAFEAQRNRNKVGQPVDRSEWGMTPPTVNAYYHPLRNEIVFPAGIMQPPLFDGTIDDAVNYGAMGAVIGHEIMHGFDDQGSRFDPDGNFANWWTDEDRAEFMRRAQVLVDQFNDYVAVDSLHVNGQLTLGENIGDLGGLIIAYEGLQLALEGQPRELIDGFTPEQRFFLSFAQAWRANMRDENLKVLVQSNPHSPPRYRAQGPVSNMVQFADAFGCDAGDPMVRPDSLRVHIW